MNGKKARRLRSQGGQKRLRRNAKANRATAAEHNAAMEALAAEQAEAEAGFNELMAKLAEEPQYAIISPFDGSVAMLAAESMILPLGTNARGESLEPQSETVGAEGAEAGVASGEVQDANPAVAAPEGDTPRIILPGTAEALGIERP